MSSGSSRKSADASAASGLNSEQFGLAEHLDHPVIELALVERTHGSRNKELIIPVLTPERPAGGHLSRKKYNRANGANGRIGDFPFPCDNDPVKQQAQHAFEKPRPASGKTRSNPPRRRRGTGDHEPSRALEPSPAGRVFRVVRGPIGIPPPAPVLPSPLSPCAKLRSIELNCATEQRAPSTMAPTRSRNPHCPESRQTPAPSPPVRVARVFRGPRSVPLPIPVPRNYPSPPGRSTPLNPT